MGNLSLSKRIGLKILNNIFSWLPDKLFIECKFYLNLYYWPKLKNPRSFNEKLQWLKLYKRNPLLTDLVDKIKVKGYVSDKIGKEYVIPTVAVYKSPEEIDPIKLPDRFVLKCNHNSGGLTICRDKSKLDLNKVKKELSKSLKYNYYKVGREWPYKNVERAVLAEQLLEGPEEGIPDYKFFCFNGKVRACMVCVERFSESGLKINFYDREWNIMPFTRHYPYSDCNIPKPTTYEKMINLAEQLAEDFEFVRIDFYSLEEWIYFGEMTFFPGNGWEDFNPIEWDYIFGSWINLDKNDQNP